MTRAIKLFAGTFFVVFILNQLFYGACFASYCLAAAFPKVVILSVIIAGFIHVVSSGDEKQ